MSAPLIISIGGTTWTTGLQDSVTINKILGRTVSTMTATLYDKNAALTPPTELAEVIVTRGDTGDRVFGGLASIIEGRTEALSRYWDIKAQGFTILLDRIIFFRSYEPGFTYGGHVGDVAILANLFETAVYGAAGGSAVASEILIDPTYVKQGTTQLSGINFPYSYAREAVELLANYVTFDYYVDDNKYLHYYDVESLPSPYSLSSTPGETLGGLTAVGYHNLRWKRDVTRLVNSFVVYGANILCDDQTTILPNSGGATVLSVAFRGTAVALAAPVGQSKIQVWKNTGTDLVPIWTAQTVGISGIDDPATKDVIYDISNLTLTFASAPPNFTNSVKVKYRFAYGGGQVYPSMASIAQYGRTLSQRLVASDANSAATIQGAIKNLTRQFSQRLEVITCSCDDIGFPGTSRFTIGQYVPFKNAILGINRSYWIHKVTTKVIGGQVRSYDLELRNYVLGA